MDVTRHSGWSDRMTLTLSPSHGGLQVTQTGVTERERGRERETLFFGTGTPGVHTVGSVGPQFRTLPTVSKHPLDA
jgi:hypothetical protein